MKLWQAWLAAIRPKTLGLSASPVWVGTALAWAEQRQFEPVVFMATWLVATCIQIGTNLHNDAVDFLQGGDGPERLGPQRASAQGWLPVQLVKQVGMGCFGLAFLLGIYLAWVGGWLIVCLGLASLAAGLAYSGGPKPISTTPFGEVFVWLFFGLVATVGSDYLQTQHISMNAVWAGSGLGLLAAAVLFVNNHRDRTGDVVIGRKTLAAVLSIDMAHKLYAGLLFAAFLMLPGIKLPAGWPWAPCLALPLAGWLSWRFAHTPISPELNALLVHNARLQLIYAVLLCIHSIYLARNFHG